MQWHLLIILDQIKHKMKIPINPTKNLILAILLFISFFPFAQATLEVQVKDCSQKSQFQHLNEFKVYRNDSLIQIVEPKFGTTPVMNDLEYGNYRVEYQTIYQKTENVAIELREKKKYTVDLCLDYMNYEAEEYQPFISRLKAGERYSIQMKSQGCFHTSEEIITIRLEKGKYNLTYLKTNKVLSEDEIQAIKNFELELNYMTSRGCTTIDLYILTYNGNEVVISDGSCAWGGFNKLKTALKLN